MKVVIAGEGPSELGDLAAHPSYRKLKPGHQRGAETRTVLGLVLFAEEAGADVLAFVRDRDRDRDREVDVGAGLTKARSESSLAIIGGMAIEEVESWILSLRGERDAERHADAKRVLRERGVEGVDALVAEVDGADLARVPDDAISLRAWLEAARAASERFQ